MHLRTRLFCSKIIYISFERVCIYFCKIFKDLFTENRGKLPRKFGLHFSLVWKICALKRQATEVVLVGWFGKCQSIKKVGGRRFVEGLYQALLSFHLAHRNVICKAKRKIEPDLRLSGSLCMYFNVWATFPLNNRWPSKSLKCNRQLSKLPPHWHPHWLLVLF